MEPVSRTALRLPRYYFLRVKRMKGSPEHLARSFAFGIFIGVLPLIPVQTIILVPLTILLRISTVTAVLAGYVVSNPLTFIPQYYSAWKLGNAVLPGWVSWEQIHAALLLITNPDPQLGMMQRIAHGVSAIGSLGFKAVVAMNVGGAIIGLPIAIASYFLSHRFFATVRKKRAMTHRLDNRK